VSTLNEDHKEIADGKKKDDEGYMAKVELDSIERSIKNLRKAIKTGDTQLPAWVQSKITRAADYIDTAAEYLQSDEGIDEETQVSFTVDPKELRADAKAAKIRALTQKGSTEGERSAAQRKTTGPTLAKGSISTGVINAEFTPSLVEKILGEEKCGQGMYWCNTDKVCKPLPDGFKVDGQKKRPTEVGIGKEVAEGKTCNHTKKGKICPVHGEKDCSIKEEKDPKGPIKSYKSPEEIAKKHGVSVEAIQKQLKIGTKVEGEHTSDKTAARITALQHLDEVPDYYSKLKNVEKKSTKSESVTIEDIFGNKFVEFIDLIKPEAIYPQKEITEATRINANIGNLIMVILSWRGQNYSLKVFFPQAKLPSRKEIEEQIQKIYPTSRVIYSRVVSEEPGETFLYAGGSYAKPGPNRNYVKPMGEEVEILEAKKSEMKCNKPKAEAHGSGETGKSHVVKACEGGKEKLIRFGQLGVKGSPKKKGESKAYASRRHKFQTRHAKNIAKGKMSAAYWANKVKW